jgi:2-beta-glucuronyltransferase
MEVVLVADILQKLCRPERYLFISGHDYRTPRRSSLHFIAQELAKTNQTRFFSLGFGTLTSKKSDPRSSIAKRSNVLEVCDEIECYLWRTLVHPGNTHLQILRPLENAAFSIYRNLPNKIFDQWLSEATVIFIESGFPVIFAERARRLNGRSKLIYIASDDLTTIGCANYLVKELARVEHLFDGIQIPSRYMEAVFSHKEACFYVPQGIDASISMYADPSPYGPGIHAVSVGSMLFDPIFFDLAANAFPEITFHIIGSGLRPSRFSQSNIQMYGEMPFHATIPYMKHAAFGIAPYRQGNAPLYLGDTSLKLIQYAYFGLPTVCPSFLGGKEPLRIHYMPGDKNSIEVAIETALSSKRGQFDAPLTWAEVAKKIASKIQNCPITE